MSCDLIYGLPCQSATGFKRTLDKVVALDPNRLSVYNYAHLPQRFKTQRQIRVADLPSPEEKLDILTLTIETLTSAGYVHIGMDHFAKPEDEFAVAQRNGMLCRNFQGYSTRAGCDPVGIGLTAISRIGDCYAQNVHSLDEYYLRLDAGNLATGRGLEADRDDRMRGEVIQSLICHMRIDFEVIHRKFGISFRDYFKTELERLAELEKDDLVIVQPQGIEVLTAGKLLIRNICSVFDRYLMQQSDIHRFSRMI